MRNTRNVQIWWKWESAWKFVRNWIWTSRNLVAVNLSWSILCCLWDPCLSALAELLLSVNLKGICRAGWDFSLYFWSVFVVQCWCHTGGPGWAGGWKCWNHAAGILPLTVLFSLEDWWTVGVWGLWEMQISEGGSRFWGWCNVEFKPCKSGGRRELRVPPSKADVQWGLLPLPGVLRDQESLREVAINSLLHRNWQCLLCHVCVSQTLCGFPCVCFLAVSAVSGPFAEIPTGLGWACGSAGGAVIPGSCSFPRDALQHILLGRELRAILARLPGGRRSLLAQDPVPVCDHSLCSTHPAWGTSGAGAGAGAPRSLRCCFWARAPLQPPLFISTRLWTRRSCVWKCIYLLPQPTLPPVAMPPTHTCPSDTAAAASPWWGWRDRAHPAQEQQEKSAWGYSLHSSGRAETQFGKWVLLPEVQREPLPQERAAVVLKGSRVCIFCAWIWGKEGRALCWDSRWSQSAVVCRKMSRTWSCWQWQQLVQWLMWWHPLLWSCPGAFNTFITSQCVCHSAPLGGPGCRIWTVTLLGGQSWAGGEGNSEEAETLPVWEWVKHTSFTALCWNEDRAWNPWLCSPQSQDTLQINIS